LNCICTNLRKSVYQPNQPNNGPTLNLFSALPYVSTYVPSTSLIDRRSHFDRRCCTGTALHRQRRRRRRQVAADESDRSAGRPVPATLQSPSYYLRPAMCRPILLPSAYQTHSLGVGFMCGVVGLDVSGPRGLASVAGFNLQTVRRQFSVTLHAFIHAFRFPSNDREFIQPHDLYSW
jgi:hypothetical protein